MSLTNQLTEQAGENGPIDCRTADPVTVDRIANDAAMCVRRTATDPGALVFTLVVTHVFTHVFTQHPDTCIEYMYSVLGGCIPHLGTP